MSDEFIECPHCHQGLAVMVGGLGIPGLPWEWECTGCGYEFTSENPEEDDDQ